MDVTVTHSSLNRITETRPGGETRGEEDNRPGNSGSGQVAAEQYIVQILSTASLAFSLDAYRESMALYRPPWQSRKCVGLTTLPCVASITPIPVTPEFSMPPCCGV
jgi:hypothetical protein